MGERKYRAQILLEPEQHKALADLAQRRGTSISQVVRDIVGEYLVEQDTEVERRLAAIERIREHRAEMLAERGGKPLDIDFAALIEEMREERAEELYANLFGGRD